MKKCISIASLIIISLCGHAQFKITDTFKIASAGGWDYIAVQPNSNRLFISHGTRVNILDKTTGDSLGVIANTIGVHGIAFVPLLNKGYTSNGKLNNVTVFDLNTFEAKDSVATGKNPDAIFYDSYSKKIITCNGGSNDVSFIDPVTDKVIAVVAVGGKPETAIGNGAGKIFVNIEDKNEIVVIDENKMKVTAHWPLQPGEAPTGLAIDLAGNRLFAACGDNNLLMVVNATDGKIITQLPIGAGCDGAVFDAATKNIFTSNGAGTMTVIHEEAKNNFTITATVLTKKGARTIGLDEQTHKLYLPTADFQLAVEKERPKMIPGTFQILVVSQL